MERKKLSFGWLVYLKSGIVSKHTDWWVEDNDGKSIESNDMTAMEEAEVYRTLRSVGY